MFVGITEEALRRIIRAEVDPIRAEIAPIRAEIAPIRQALKIVIEMQLDPWENIMSITTEAVIEEETRNLDHVSNFYGTPTKRYCMVLGDVTGCHIACAHIWPKFTHGNGLTAFNLKPEDVNSSRNFLRFHKTIEVAFDHKRIIFETCHSSAATAGVSETTRELKLKLVVLDPSLLTELILDNSERVIKEWKDLHDKEIHYTFVGDKKPYLRLLAAHSFRAVEKALNLGWIDASIDTNARRERAFELARLSLGNTINSIGVFSLAM